MPAVSEPIENILVFSNAPDRRRLVERPVDHAIPTCLEVHARQSGVDSQQFTLELRKMRRGIARLSHPIIEEIAGASTADVDAIVLGQAEIENFLAAVVERNSL